MRNLIFCFISFCNLFSSKEKPFDSVWKHRRETRPLNTIEILPFTETTYVFPFVTEKFDTGTINGMIRKMVQYDSLYERNSSRLTDSMPEPIIAKIGKQIISYSQKIEVKIGSEKYIIYSLATNNGEYFTEHNCYKFYVVENIGTIFAYNERENSSYDEVEHYTLSDIRDKNGQSVIDGEALKQLVEAAKGD